MKKMVKINIKGGVLAAFMLLLTLSSVSAYDNETQRFENGSIINFSTYCASITHNPCGSGTTCNLTLYRPNGSLLVNKVNMSYMGSGVYNYSLGNLTLEGYYSGSVFCNDGTYNGTAAVALQVVDDLNPPQLLWDLGIMIAVLGAAWFFYKLSRDLAEDHTALKLLFTFMTFWLIILAVGLALSIANGVGATAGIITNLTSGYRIVLYTLIFAVCYILIYFVKKTLEGVPVG